MTAPLEELHDDHVHAWRSARADAVPATMRDLPAWLCWRKKPEPGKAKFAKVPVYANGKNRSGTNGSPADRSALVLHDDALQAEAALQLDGVGFAVLPDNGVVAVDVDNARDSEDSEWKPLAQELLATGTYAEVSPSGLGLRLFFAGEPTSNNKNAHASDDGVGVELFGSKGFVTFTARRLNGSEVLPLSDEVRARLEQLAHSRTDNAPGGRAAKIVGNRNVALASWAGTLRRIALDHDEMLAALSAINQARCEPPLSAHEVADIARKISAKPAGRVEEWSRPLNLFAAFAAPPLTARDVPPVIGDYAERLARASGFDFTVIALACVVVSAAAIDDGFRLRLPGNSGHFESARLWGVAIGQPEAGKTPAQDKAVAPVYAVHKTWVTMNASPAKGKAGDGEQTPQRAAFTSDCTIDKLSEVLTDNPRGVLFRSNEFDAWLGQHEAFSRDKGSRDRGEWMALYDGGPHQVDRVNRGSFFIPNWGVSLLTATTPAALTRLAPKLSADGLLQRFLVFSVVPQRDEESDIDVDQARDVYDRRVRALFGHNISPGDNAVVLLSPGAAALFKEEKRNLRALVDSATSVSESFAAHVAKHVGMLARVALTFHAVGDDALLVDGALHHPSAQPVSTSTMRLAIRFMHRAYQHAFGVYSHNLGTASPMELARAMASSLLADNLATFNRREIQAKCRAFRTASEWQRTQAFTALQDCGWLRTDDAVPTHGTRWDVNPQAHEEFANEGEAARERRRLVRERIAEENE